MIDIHQVIQVFKKSAAALRDNADSLIELDQQVGDGDLGITARKIADALEAYMTSTDEESDIGKWIMTCGMKINSAAPSTMGSLLAIALMRTGKIVKGKSKIAPADVVVLLKSAESAIMEKGKANLGDKTLLDALHPAIDALETALADGTMLADALPGMVAAAQKGLEGVVPLRSKVGRASWLGERTEGKVDPGCALVVVILKGLI